MMTVASGRNYYQLSEPISVSFVLHCAQSPCRDTCADTRACISPSRYPTLSARAQRYRIARQRHLDRLLCQRRRSGVQRDYSIRRSLRTKKQLSVTGTGTCTQSRLTGPGIRALDFKLLGLKERPPP
jgi:hypothetical protein